MAVITFGGVLPIVKWLIDLRLSCTSTKKIDVRFSPKAVDHRALKSAIACSRVVE